MKILPITILILLLAPVFVFAAYWECPAYDPMTPCSNLCFADYCIGNVLEPGPCYELWEYGDYCPLQICCLVIRITRWLYFIAAGLALIVVIWSGVMYMMAGGEEAKATKAKKILLYGLIGALVIFASGYILSTVISFLY